MWQTKYRKNVLSFDTNTNNHLERFNRTLKDRISPHMHIPECISKLISVVDDTRAEEMNLCIKLKQKIYNDNDSALVQRFVFQLVNKAIDILRKQNEELKTKHYFVEELEDDTWKIGQKDDDKDRFVTSSIIHRDLYDLLSCDCKFFYRINYHVDIIFLFNIVYDETIDETKAIEDIVSVNKRWLKATIDNYLNETICNDNKQNPNSQCKMTQMAPKKIQTLSTSDKYNLVKPTLDLLTARITQCGTTKFNDHLNFLNIVLNQVNVNKYKALHNYAIGLECKDTE